MNDSLETRKLVSSDKTVAHYVNIDGTLKMHNWDGPALVPQGNKRLAEYYLFGIRHTRLEWEDKKKDVNGVPFYKTSVGKSSGARM